MSSMEGDTMETPKKTYSELEWIIKDQVHQLTTVTDKATRAANAYTGLQKKVTRLLGKISKITIPPDQLQQLATRAAGFAAEDNWAEAEKILRNYRRIGECPRCSINLYGAEKTPDAHIMPCGVGGCPYDKTESTDASTD